MLQQIGRVCSGSLHSFSKGINFTIAYSSKRGSDETNYLSCVSFIPRQIEVLNEHLKEGQMIQVQGNLELWKEEKEGKTYHNTSCYISDFNLLPFQFHNNKTKDDFDKLGA